MGEVKPEPVGGVWPTVNPSVISFIDTTKLFSEVNKVPVTENIQVTQNTFEKNARGDKWDFEEDMALMSAWCVASEDQFRNKNQKKTSLWAQVKKLYDEAQTEYSKKLGPRNENQMKGRWKRLNESAIKWIDAYRKAYKQKTPEMSLKDVENEAHKIYAACGSMYNDVIVFNEVMCKHPKWKLLNDRDTTRSRRECEARSVESGGSTKRARTTEEGEGNYCVISNPETPNSGGSTIQRVYKKKEKLKVSQSSLFGKEFVVELRALRITRESEVEVMKKRLEFELKKEERNLRKEERKIRKEERKIKKAYYMLLNTLLKKENLSPEEEDMKRHLLAMLYGK